jgi:hypothetical protein
LHQSPSEGMQNNQFNVYSFKKCLLHLDLFQRCNPRSRTPPMRWRRKGSAGACTPWPRSPTHRNAGARRPTTRARRSPRRTSRNRVGRKSYTTCTISRPDDRPDRLRSRDRRSPMIVSNYLRLSGKTNPDAELRRTALLLSKGFYHNDYSQRITNCLRLRPACKRSKWTGASSNDSIRL